MRALVAEFKFQSLSGFLMSCNHRIQVFSAIFHPSFQSLSGFLMSCNDAQDPWYYLRVWKFQSLSGFLMSCNWDYIRHNNLPYCCFNPYRVF